MPDPTTEAVPAGNAPDVTAAEAKLLAPEPVVVAAVEGAPVVDPAAAVVEAPTPVVEAPSQPAAPFVPAYAAPAARDFATELTAADTALQELRKQRAAGELDELTDDQYEAQLDTLRDTRSEIKSDAKIHQMQSELASQSQNQAWEYLQNQFFAVPGNAEIRADGMRFAAWENAMQVVVNEAALAGKQITDWEVMSGARDKMAAAGMLGGAATPTATGTPTPQPKPDRSAPLKDVPASLAHVPAAAESGQRPTSQAMGEMGGIEDIERTFANKTEAERDMILRGVPGMFVDG